MLMSWYYVTTTTSMNYLFSLSYDVKKNPFSLMYMSREHNGFLQTEHAHTTKVCIMFSHELIIWESLWNWQTQLWVQTTQTLILAPVEMHWLTSVKPSLHPFSQLSSSGNEEQHTATCSTAVLTVALFSFSPLFKCRHCPGVYHDPCPPRLPLSYSSLSWSVSSDHVNIIMGKLK